MRIVYTGGMEPKDISRFLSKIVFSSDNECWLWKGSTHKFGYGWFRLKGKTLTAHKISLILFSGSELTGKQVLHSCDNPSCCNPKHLRWGTPLDNVRDAIARGRHVKPPKNNINPPIRFGEDNNKAILNNKKVLCLRKDRSEGVSARELSRKYGVSIPTVYQVINEKTWKGIKLRKGGPSMRIVYTGGTF